MREFLSHFDRVQLTFACGALGCFVTTISLEVRLQLQARERQARREATDATPAA